jgi:endonuclease/exonuclease/phosphatase family metal-dependent hydrolase
MRSPSIILLAMSLIGGCRTGRNYPGIEGPRYVGRPVGVESRDRLGVDTLRIVSFNIAFAREIDRAIELIMSEPALRRADVFLLQEMDVEGTKRLASALDMSYVYYPAIYHLRAHRDFGNAVLSRWPIVEDAKLVLPHVSRYAGTQRIATAATIRVGAAHVRVYSTHLGTVLDVGNGARRDQVRAIVEDAKAYAYAVVGGDFNSSSVASVGRDAGYAWPTERGPSTTRGGRYDHILLKQLRVPDSAGAGTIASSRGSSDHRPIWVTGILR